VIPFDQEHPDNPYVNRGVFTIVKTPFYPETFARYSTRVEIIVTRHADVNILPVDYQFRLRRQANLSYRAHGVQIHDRDLDTLQQPTGLWIHDEPYVLKKK
jgi:hypothetical protein